MAITRPSVTDRLLPALLILALPVLSLLMPRPAFAEAPVLMQFWASWCGSCRSLMNETDTLARNAAIRLEFISIDTSESDFAAARDQLPKEMQERTRRDADQSLAKTWKVVTVPTLLLLDRDRNVVFRHVGHLAPKESLALAEALRDASTR